MTSSPVSRLNCAEILDFFFPLLLFFFEGNHLTYISEIPQTTMTLPGPILCWKYCTSPATISRGGTHLNLKKKKKQYMVRAEFPGVVNLPWNTDTSACSPNTAGMKEGEEDHLLSREKIKQSHGILKTQLKLDETQKRVIMKMMWCRITWFSSCCPFRVEVLKNITCKWNRACDECEFVGFCRVSS